MLGWVYRAARDCAQLDEILIATDSTEVLDFAESRGWKGVLTPASCASGTDRIHHVAQSFPADIYVNIQGDEPLLRREHIEALLLPFARSDHEALAPAAEERVQVTTLATPCALADVANPNVVKVVLANSGRALYFSRAAVPFDRDHTGAPHYLKHLGLYGYRKTALDRFPALPPSALESAERLEQLRFLQNGIDITVEITPHDTIGVDTEEDLRAVEAILLSRRS